MSNGARNPKNGGGGIMANGAVSRSGGEYFYTVHFYKCLIISDGSR